MTLKQKMCGFGGHNFELVAAKTEKGKRTSHVRMHCTKCGFTTEWHSLRTASTSGVTAAATGHRSSN